MRPDLVCPMLWSCWVTLMPFICFKGIDCFHVSKLWKARVQNCFCSSVENSQGRAALPGNSGMKGMLCSSLHWGLFEEFCTCIFSIVNRVQRMQILTISLLNLSERAKLVKIRNTKSSCGAWIVCNWACRASQNLTPAAFTYTISFYRHI